MSLKKTDKKGKEYEKNIFEIHLKEDFLDLFLRSDYEKLFLKEEKRKNMQLLNVNKIDKRVHHN